MYRPWFWEFVQNLPLCAAFFYGYAYYVRGELPAALACTAVGAAAGSLLIRYTEPLIAPGPLEKPAVTLGNFVFFCLAIPLFILYFSWKPGSPLLDAGVGLATGAAISLIQSAAARRAPGWRHTVSMGLAASLAVLAIRWLVLVLDPLPAALLLNVGLTTVITAVEYVE